MHANADPAELQRFGDIAHRWWDPQGSMRPLHEINPVRLEWIERTAGGLGGKDVVDVGCGGGILAEAMSGRGARVLGIDLTPKLLRVAELHALETQAQVKYRQASAEQLATEAPGSFDAVTCMEMLEHVPDPASVITACARLAKPGGHVFFSTINRNPKSFVLAIVGAEYVLNLLPRGTHEYAKFIRPSELAGFARGAGLAVTEVIGMRYNPLTKRATLGADTGVNYLVACRKEA